MKTKLVALLGLAAVAISAYATLITLYDNAKPPGISLPVAYERAANALGSATNQFHCLSARVATDYGADGEWQFAFFSTNSRPKHKWVTVEFNGKIHVEDILAR